MARLADVTLDQAPPDIARPAYERRGVAIGVVHLGPGAFHRGHQASFIDRLLAADPRWGICGVSLKSPALREALAPQDGLYTLVELGQAPRLRVIGALKEILTAPLTPDWALARLADPAVALITLTVTEKGYGLDAAGALDPGQADITHDLARPATPASAIGWLVEGLRRRLATGAPPPSVVSCDNLPDNGHRLGDACAEMARRQDDAALADWIAAQVAFPNTMVDSITPATDASLRALVRERLGLEDAWPVQREPFTQWVIEDRLNPGGPDLAAVGVTLAADVRPFELAKLRLLNAAHSSLAYLGLLAGLDHVSEAMAAPWLARFIETLLVEDIAPWLPAGGPEPLAYIAAILTRFRNPAIRHRLAQIAADGSQKLPARLVPSLAAARAAGQPLDRLVLPLAAWIAFIRREIWSGRAVADPLAARLAAKTLEADAATLLGDMGILTRDLASDPQVRAALNRALARLAEPDRARWVG